MDDVFQDTMQGLDIIALGVIDGKNQLTWEGIVHHIFLGILRVLNFLLQ